MRQQRPAIGTLSWDVGAAVCLWVRHQAAWLDPQQMWSCSNSHVRRLRPCASSSPRLPPAFASQVLFAPLKVDALADVNNRLQASLAEATTACRGERAKRDNLHKQVCSALPACMVCSIAGQQLQHLSTVCHMWHPKRCPVCSLALCFLALCLAQL